MGQNLVTYPIITSFDRDGVRRRSITVCIAPSIIPPGQLAARVKRDIKYYLEGYGTIRAYEVILVLKARALTASPRFPLLADGNQTLWRQLMALLEDDRAP